MRSLSLTTRAFLFSFAPVCLVLLCFAIAVNTAVHNQIRRELRDQLRESDLVLNRAQSEYSHRVTMLISKLAESAGLKAAVGLLSEVHNDPSLLKQAHDTISVQLRDLQTSSGFEFLAVTDLEGNVVTAVPRDRPIPQLPLAPGIVQIGGKLYQVHSVPIAAGEDQITALVLGNPFEIGALSLPGEAALFHDGRIIASTFPTRLTALIEKEIASRCSVHTEDCEISIAGEAFVVSEMQKGQMGSRCRLFGFQSLDRPAQNFASGFLKVLMGIAAAGICLALAFTFLTARSVSRPLRALVAQLRDSEHSGGLSMHLTAGNGVRELAGLASAYNNVVDSEQRTRRELESARDAAQLANRLKDEFLTNISHELRTPLNGVLGMTELLLQTSLDGDQQDFALTAKSSANELLTLIEAILNFSQLQTGRVSLQTSPFDLKKVIQDTAAAIAPKAEAKELRLEIEHAPAFPSLLVGDETGIRQILAQLCDNAVKFTDTGFIRIRVGCDQDRDMAKIRIAVEDSGIGIAPEQQDLIFDRFTQADGSLTRRKGGTGLGLALVKDLATLMKGQVGVESRPGEGSTFWFTLDLPIAVESLAC
jgi:signal transduction histidine kinase